MTTTGDLRLSVRRLRPGESPLVIHEGRLIGAQELIDLCGSECRLGDQVAAEVEAPWWNRRLRHAWPLSEKVAEEMVDPSVILERSDNDQELWYRRFGPLGAVGIHRFSGPPKWVLPRIKPLARRRIRAVGIQFGWRYTAYRVIWALPKKHSGR